MTEKLTILAPKFVSEYRWQVSYDGRILGDDRGYSTEADCRAEIANRLAIDARDAVKYDRPILYTAETPAMTDKDEATHYLITPGGAVPVIADDEVHAIQIAGQMGIANIVSRIDPAMTVAQFMANTATAPEVWAAYLVDGIVGDLLDADRAEADAFIARLGWGRPGEAGPTAYLEDHDALPEYPLACTCAVYTFQPEA